MPALAQAMPRVIGNAKDPQCREAFALALASYRSDNFLFSDVEPPKGWPAHLLLGWDGQNNADIWYDKAAFVERSDAPILYWQLHPSGNKRFVGIDIWPNWKGDYFNILLIDAALSEAQVRAAQEAGSLQSPLNEKDQILFRDRSGAYGLITLPEGYEVERVWNVEAVRHGRVMRSCEILLRDWTGKPVDQLPPAVRDFARSLRRALGPPYPGSNGFTHASREIDVAKAWANAVDRPWGLAAYNDELAAFDRRHLRAWGAQNRAQSAVLDRLRTQRRPAMRALADYYSRRFGLAPSDAERVSGFVLDYMVVPHFAFDTTSEQEEKEWTSHLTRNPWPARAPRG